MSAFAKAGQIAFELFTFAALLNDAALLREQEGFIPFEEVRAIAQRNNFPVPTAFPIHAGTPFHLLK